MAGMNENYLNVMRDAGKAAVAYVNVVNSSGQEVSTRKLANWVNDGDGTIRLGSDLTFLISNAENVTGWRGYASSVAGISFGGRDVPSEPFPNGGEYTLLAASTAIQHTSP